MYQGTILALDIATQTGWAEGEPDAEAPRFGSLRLAPEGAGQAAIFGGMIGFAGTRFQAFRPRTVVFEAPELYRLKSGKATRRTIEVLFGLPAVLSGVCNRYGIHDLQEATPNDVRGFFIGNRSLPREQAKKAVLAECRRRGWNCANDDESDACAMWAFMVAIKRPDLRDRLGAGAPLLKGLPR